MMPSDAKKMLLVSGRAFPELAEEVAACLGIKPTPTKLFDFANGEIFVRFLDSVRGCDVFALQSHTSPINEWIMEQLIMVDALKRASARRITVVTPFFGYARQDKKNRGREPISARLMADLFATAGASRLMAVDLHTAQIQGFFDGPVDHLFALPILASYLEKKLDLSQVTVVAPDAGRVRVCERWTDRLGCPLAIIHKRRDPDVANQVRMFEVVGQVAGRTCILVDDMIDTGATIAKAAEALFEQGADRVIATATHGVLSGAAVDILKNSQDQRDHHHEHAAGAAGEAVRQAHRAVHRAAAGPGDQRGVQRRLGHQPVRRPELRRPELDGPGRAGAEPGRAPETVVPAPARAFCLLGLWQGPSISSARPRPCSASRSSAQDALEVLVDTHLLESVATDRYRFHDLLRVYAADRAAADLPAAERDAAVIRLLTWYMRTADAAASAVAPHRYNMPLDRHRRRRRPGSPGPRTRSPGTTASAPTLWPRPARLPRLAGTRSRGGCPPRCTSSSTAVVTGRTASPPTSRYGLRTPGRGPQPVRPGAGCGGPGPAGRRGPAPARAISASPPMDDPADRAVVVDAARALERVPELLGLGPHLLATAVRPAHGPRPARLSATLRTRIAR